MGVGSVVGTRIEYWELLQSGVDAVTAASRSVWAARTGYRWRAERGGLPPA
jgi:hypothetical protein